MAILPLFTCELQVLKYLGKPYSYLSEIDGFNCAALMAL
jgi:hypothetical protein